MIIQMSNMDVATIIKRIDDLRSSALYISALKDGVFRATQDKSIRSTSRKRIFTGSRCRDQHESTPRVSSQSQTNHY